jgi:7,8-dihydropterin-6-yl-methyl-4-(beta-D-ribofuranosyl)aminobenzene 5'-phosphate synthase
MKCFVSSIAITAIIILSVSGCVGCASTARNTGIKEQANEAAENNTGINMTVLLENYTIDKQYAYRHGLSLLIDNNGTNILLDAGPDSKFSENAEKMNIDLSQVDYAFLSHNHTDHTGGINEFIEKNDSAPIYLMDSIDSTYYGKFLFVYIPTRIKLSGNNRSRIIQQDKDLVIGENISFFKNTALTYNKPSTNKRLYKKENGGTSSGKIVPDTFDHEGILVFEDNNELVVFDSCSHNGILNVIETVKLRFPDKKIRSYVGGLHLSDPFSGGHETDENLDTIIEELQKTDIQIYTGHCTGEYSLNYLKERLGDQMHEINTGMRLDV